MGRTARPALVVLVGLLTFRFRLANPESFWARRFYRSEKNIARATRRHETYERRRLALRDRLFGG